MAMLVYDHFLTFSDEVEHVWKRKRSAVSVLCLINRYYTLLCMILVISVSHDLKACNHFIHFEKWGISIPLVAIPGVLLILRVYALYDRNIYILVYLSALLLGTIGVGIWEVSFPGGGQLHLHYQRINELQGCAFMPSLGLGPLASSFLTAYLAFDVSIFILTMLKTRRSLWADKSLPLLRRLGQDGALYFLAISSSVSIWLFMVIFAPWQMKWMNALPTFCLMATMITRLTISIRVNPVVDLSASTEAMQEPQLRRHCYSLRQRIWMRIRGRSSSNASMQYIITDIMARRLSDADDVESSGGQMAQVL